MGVFSKEYIPQGTRFGPLQGNIYTKDSVPKESNRKYFWRVSKSNMCATSLLRDRESLRDKMTLVVKL